MCGQCTSVQSHVVHHYLLPTSPPTTLSTTTTDTLLLAPFLYHPGLQWLLYELPSLLLASISVLPSFLLSHSLLYSNPQPLNIIQPSSKIFDDDGIVEQHLLPPRKFLGIAFAARTGGGFHGCSDFWKERGMYGWPLRTIGFDTRHGERSCCWLFDLTWTELQRSHSGW